MASPDSLQRDFDLIVIGTGPAGIHAAVQAAKIHKRVCIIEKDPKNIGGSWIHTGTLPSKTLREGLAAIRAIQEHVGKHWVNRMVDDLQTGKLFARARAVSAQEEVLLQEHINSNRIHVQQGFGSVENDFSVRVVSPKFESMILSTEFILIATGSSPDRPAHIPFDGWRIVDSDDIFNLENIPKMMTIYGAGVIGCEYACIFAAMGVDVTLVDGRAQILQYCDQEVIRELRSFMEAMGVKFKLGVRISHLAINGPKVNISIGEDSLETDVLFWAGGRVPATSHLGLERLGIELDHHGSIKVNENFQTAVGNIYAAGDAIGPPALAATATEQGRFVACHAFGTNLGRFAKDFPIGIYTIPECSMVGKTEEALIREGREYVVGRAQYKEIARSTIGGKRHGLLKLLICSKTHKILGIHIVGEDACNLVHIGLAFMTKGGHAQDLINMIFNYPTLAEGYRIAAFNGLNKIFTDGVIKPPPLERRANRYSSSNRKK